MMNSDDVKRLQSRELHESTGVEAPEIEHMNDGFSDQLKSNHYRLAIVGNEHFLFLTDLHTRECTCHGKGMASIDELIALLQRAQTIIQGGV